MKLLITFLFYFLIFTILHELGHLFTAKIFRLKIQKFGFQIIPFPSFFVSVQAEKYFYVKLFYYLSGIIFILIIFSVILFSGIYKNKVLLDAILLRIILDLNPFHSDILFLIGKEKYRYSIFWYIHFFLWWILIIFILKNYKFLLS